MKQREICHICLFVSIKQKYTSVGLTTLKYVFQSLWDLCSSLFLAAGVHYNHCVGLSVCLSVCLSVRAHVRAPLSATLNFRNFSFLTFILAPDIDISTFTTGRAHCS